MNNIAIIVPVVLAISLVALRLLYPRKNSKKAAAPVGIPVHAIIGEELPAPRHFRYFPQIRQALSSTDAEYLLRNAPKADARQALRERRAVAQGFLAGLHEDFTNLSKLGRMVAALSPEISHKQEADRLNLIIRFQVLYAIVWLRLYTGNLPLEQMERLTGLVSRLAARMGEAMAEISAQSARNIAETSGC